MANEDIRAEIKASGLCLWQVADALGITDGNFSRKLRYELSVDEKAHIRELITHLVKEGDPS